MVHWFRIQNISKFIWSKNASILIIYADLHSRHPVWTIYIILIYFTLKSGWKRCLHAKKHENKSEDNWPEGIKHSNELFKQRATHNVRTAFDWDYHPVYSQCQNYIYLRQLPCDSPVTKLPVSQLSFSYTCCW